MTTAYTSLLGLALPVTGELSGTWGDTVNNSITSLLDSAVAGTQTLTADTTLTTTTGAANQSRQAILLCSPASANITITAPAQSKIYTVINTSATYTVTVRGVGPTTGVTLGVSEKAVVAWNGSDFVRISNTGGAGVFTSITDSGNLTFTGTGNRITGDFSNATVASRVMVQSSTVNGGTTFEVIPNGTSTLATLNVSNSSSDLANTSFGSVGITAANTDVRIQSGIRGTGTYLPMTFYTGGSENVRIDTTGNLMIGATSPYNATTDRVTIRRSQNAITQLLVDNQDAGSSAQTRLALEVSGGGWYVANQKTGNPLTFSNGASGSATERMRIDSSGNLLVGTSGTANGKVHINGSVVYTVPATFSASIGANAAWTTGYGSQAINLSLWASSGIGGVSVYNVSDRRLKEQITQLTGTQALSFIEKTKPVQFVWKEEQTTDTGFIAQDILAAGFGHLVSMIPDNAVQEEIDENGNVSPAGSRFVMKYDSVIPILTAAIKEQQALIAQLTARITALEGA